MTYIVRLYNNKFEIFECEVKAPFEETAIGMALSRYMDSGLGGDIIRMTADKKES